MMFFSQQPYRCRLDWGRRGVQDAAARGDILVVVDTLSFSTAVATAIQYGGLIYPCAETEDPAAMALRVGAELAVRRKDVPTHGRFSLSPLTFQSIKPDTRVVLTSPNGATCSRYSSSVPHLFIGTLINAAAVAGAINTLLAHTSYAVTVIACGERWNSPSEDGALRFAVEDYLGSGALLSCIHETKSPEACICEGAFTQAREQLAALLWECGSGRELRAKGYEDDVRHATQLHAYDAVPVMIDGCIQRFHS